MIFAISEISQAKTGDRLAKRIKTSKKFVYLNDLIELKCNFYYFQNSSNTSTTNNSIAKPSLGTYFRLGIFKKENELIQLNKSVYHLLIKSPDDGGNYECGSYRIDKHGQMTYMVLDSWDIEVQGKNIYRLTTFETKIKHFLKLILLYVLEKKKFQFSRILNYNDTLADVFSRRVNFNIFTSTISFRIT